jgi:hypothetical protein
MYLKDARGRPVRLSSPGAAAYDDHFYFDGQLILALRRGGYTFELDAGPEYRPQTGHFEIERHADDTKRVEMQRFANLSEEGWWGGDLDYSRPLSDTPLILRAEGLQDVGVSEFAMLLGLGGAGGEPRENTNAPTGNSQSSALSPGFRAPINVARVPYAWDLPVWLARGELDAIQLIHHHALRGGVADHENDGRPRDRSLFPGRRGNGRWSEAVYHHVLNCGLKIPPAAGSGAGGNGNPVGANRVYVYCGEEFSPARWWDGLTAGRVFVTNGPLLRPTVEGYPPGHVFDVEEGGRLTLEIGLDLATRVPIDYLQIVQNGRIKAEVRLADWKSRKGRLPPLVFEQSGWFLVRAATNNPQTYEFACTGPYYVEQGGRPRISRGSVAFFLDWIAAARSRIEGIAALDASTRGALLADQQEAEQFFTSLLAKANAD